jgi:Flp pilus assembly protein TadG
MRRMIMKTYRYQKKPHIAGQSLVEFAVILPVFLFLMMGVLDLGRIFFIYIAMYNAAQEGALYACTNPRCVYQDNEKGCPDPDNAVYRAIRESEIGAVQWEEAMIQFSPENPISGGYIEAEVTYTFEMITSAMQLIVPDLTLTARAECKVLGAP